MADQFFVTDGAVDDWLKAQGTVAPKGSETWRRAERELIDLAARVAEKKQPKPDGNQLVYKCGRELVREALGDQHPLAKWDGGSLELYLHVTTQGQLVAVRRRGRTSRKQGGA